jgi:capsule polysaccharide export protein KpsE/RkpR
MVDLVTVLLGIVVGAGLGAGVSYYVFYSKPKATKVPVTMREPSGKLSTVTVSAAELERSRREMRTTMVERDLLSSALMKLYEAESEGRITKEEREAIARRYSDQIKDLQSKLKDVELVVEVGELEKLREELVGMLQEKIRNIEARLDQAKERLTVATPQTVKKEAPVIRVEKGDELERVVEKRSKPEMSEGDRRVKEIRDEVMEALTRLEQIDVEKKQQES